MFRKWVAVLVLLGLSVLSSGGLVSSVASFVKYRLLRRPTPKDRFVQHEEDALHSKVRELTESILELRDEVRTLRRGAGDNAAMVRKVRRAKDSLERQYRKEAQRKDAEMAADVEDLRLRFEEKSVLQRATLLGELREQFEGQKAELETQLKAGQAEQVALKGELAQVREQYSGSLTSVAELKELLSASAQRQADSATELKRAEKSSKKELAELRESLRGSDQALSAARAEVKEVKEVRAGSLESRTSPAPAPAPVPVAPAQVPEEEEELEVGAGAGAGAGGRIGTSSSSGGGGSGGGDKKRSIRRPSRTGGVRPSGRK
ncbi:hypothetical protein B484DRAFT_430897 [Ochromonadaceae sp. CCMP2298]|nr:hypothetical protein B484DRAFT_430897 [Ochromonadaceae sp. CCMP2298]